MNQPVPTRVCRVVARGSLYTELPGSGSSASPDELARYLDENLASGGNGAQEIRSWIVAHGAAGARGFEIMDYLPVPEVYVGCGFAKWNLSPKA